MLTQQLYWGMAMQCGKVVLPLNNDTRLPMGHGPIVPRRASRWTLQSDEMDGRQPAETAEVASKAQHLPRHAASDVRGHLPLVDTSASRVSSPGASAPCATATVQQQAP